MDNIPSESNLYVEYPMDKVKEYWPQILGVIGIVSPLLGWLGTTILEGAEQKGYNEAYNQIKAEYDEEYNEAIRDAIIFRAKWESCCTDHE